MRHLLVFDLDGCLYNYNALPDQGFYRLCDEANALAAKEIFPELGYEKALALSAQSFNDHHDCYGAFVIYANTIGLDPLEARHALFKKHHALLFNLLEERHPNFFDHTAPTAEALAHLSGGPFASAILSHSCMEGWGKPVLAKMGILEYFEQHLLFGMDDYGFTRKFESAAPMQEMIRASRFTADRIIFIEDSLQNTIPAAQHLGIKIAIIHHDAPRPSSQPKGVRWLSETPATLLHTLAQEYAVNTDLRTTGNNGPAILRL